MYFGLDMWGGWDFSKHRRHDHCPSFFETEARIGYNLFYNGRDHFTPLAGAGYLAFNHLKNSTHLNFMYTTTGFKYSHEFNTVFGLGLNAKGLAGQQVSRSQPKEFAWGFDVSLPIIFRFAHYRHWDITLEPAYLYVDSNHNWVSVFAGRATVGYRF